MLVIFRSVGRVFVFLMWATLMMCVTISQATLVHVLWHVGRRFVWCRFFFLFWLLASFFLLFVFLLLFFVLYRYSFDLTKLGQSTVNRFSRKTINYKKHVALPWRNFFFFVLRSQGCEVVRATGGARISDWLSGQFHPLSSWPIKWSNSTVASCGHKRNYSKQSSSYWRVRELVNNKAVRATAQMCWQFSVEMSYLPKMVATSRRGEKKSSGTPSCLLQTCHWG